MANPTIETDIAEILKDLQSGQKEILKEISDLKVSLSEVKGDIKVLNTSIQELDKRVSKLAHSLATCGELNAFVSAARGRSPIKSLLVELF